MIFTFLQAAQRHGLTMARPSPPIIIISWDLLLPFFLFDLSNNLTTRTAQTPREPILVISRPGLKVNVLLPGLVFTSDQPKQNLSFSRTGQEQFLGK